MKTLMTLVVAALAVSAVAEEPKAPKNPEAAKAALAKLTKEADALPKSEPNKRTLAEQRPEVLKRTGGFVDVAPRGTSVLVVDARPKAGGAPDQFAEVFANLSKTNVQVEKSPLPKDTCPVKMLDEHRAARKAFFAIAVIDDPKLTGLTILPEERLAVVNAAKYQQGPDPVRREERIHKELWRALGFVSGVGYAPYTNDVLQPVFSVPELDRLEYQVMQPMNFQKIYTMMGKAGITRARHIPYRLSVMEGWAAAPTNEYQKAVWEEVKAMERCRWCGTDRRISLRGVLVVLDLDRVGGLGVTHAQERLSRRIARRRFRR